MIFAGTGGASNYNLKPQPTTSILRVQSLEIEMAEEMNPPVTNAPSSSGHTKGEETSKVEDETPQSQTSGLMDMIFKFCCFWRT